MKNKKEEKALKQSMPVQYTYLMQIKKVRAFASLTFFKQKMFCIMGILGIDQNLVYVFL